MSGCCHYDCSVDMQCFTCKEFFPCRLCHDQAKNEEEKDPKKRHTVNRYEIAQIRCRNCNTEQAPQGICSNCSQNFGDYFCLVCRIFENNKNKCIYHCEGCNICRLGPQENFFHCYACEACLAVSLKDSHKCKQGITKVDCVICQENMFYSRIQSMSMKCGHYIHSKCYKEMLKNNIYTCPLCLKYVIDVDENAIQALDDEIKATPMPEEFKEMKVNILCNECGKKSEVNFHVFGFKCASCGGYNTSRI